MAKSGDKLFGGFATITIKIAQRIKVRSMMYAARYIAVDILQKKTEIVISNIVKSIIYSPFLILAAEELEFLQFDYRC